MLTDEQRAVLESLACMSSPYENEILWSILANEKASAIHLDNAAIERARDAWFDNSGSFESRLRAAISAASAAPADEGSISIQEAWEAAGGNPGIKATRDDLLIALQDLDAAVDELSAAPAEGRETSAPTCNIAVDLTRELVRSAWVKRFNYVYDRMAEDAELMGFARAIQLECFKTIATGPTKPADEGRTGRTACCPYCTDPHCGGCLATAPTISEATRDTQRLDWLLQQVCCDEIEGISIELGMTREQHFAEFRRQIDAEIERDAAKGESDE